VSTQALFLNKKNMLST